MTDDEKKLYDELCSSYNIDDMSLDEIKSVIDENYIREVNHILAKEKVMLEKQKEIDTSILSREVDNFDFVKKNIDSHRYWAENHAKELGKKSGKKVFNILNRSVKLKKLFGFEFFPRIGEIAIWDTLCSNKWILDANYKKKNISSLMLALQLDSKKYMILLRYGADPNDALVNGILNGKLRNEDNYKALLCLWLSGLDINQAKPKGDGSKWDYVYYEIKAKEFKEKVFSTIIEDKKNGVVSSNKELSGSLEDNLLEKKIDSNIINNKKDFVRSVNVHDDFLLFFDEMEKDMKGIIEDNKTFIKK